ncbi:MAG: NUDIX domain-containing protein [Gammaproteobacteria bacterium]|nr:NUDIX domain-containing protein [Gammaproteobacteria bacterium]
MCTPGGGLEPGESTRDGLRRELREELGLAEPDIGEVVWLREHTFDWGPRRIRQREVYHVVRVDRFTPRLLDAVEAEPVVALRWFAATSLATIQEEVAPRALASIVTGYLRHGPPAAPLDWVVDPLSRPTPPAGA